MPGLFSRVKTWVSTEDVTYSDLNTEFDNIITYFTPLYMDDYSTNATQMQVTADPGEVGTESLATTMAGEIARIRFMLAEITGESQWYTSPSTSLTGLANAIGSGLTDNRLVSGRVLTTSAQPAFLVPNGAARTVKLDGTPTNFIYYVEGAQYTISADTTLTGLTAAPSSNNTCLINDAIAADQTYTKYTGENGTEIPVDAMGSEISALVGKFAAFKLSNGSADEYFIAYVKSSTILNKAHRGYFFDSADAPIPRIVYTDNDTITLMKLTWVFAKTDLTLTATYTNPIWSDDEPSSPAQGDYWFDTSANKWKVYGVGSYSDADAMLVGVCIQDATNTVAARSFEFFANYSSDNTVELFYESATQAKSKHPGSIINVYGTTQKFERNLITWDITLDRATGVSESSNTVYYFYITETGDKIISDVKPYDRQEDLGGYYHTHQSWRCVGSIKNNGSSNLDSDSVESYFRRYSSYESPIAATTTDKIEVVPKIVRLDSSGGTFTTYLPPVAQWRGQTIRFIKTNSELTAATISTSNNEQIVGGRSGTDATFSLYTKLEMVDLYSDGTYAWVRGRYIPKIWSSAAAISVGATTSAPTKGNSPTTDTIRWCRDGSFAEVEAAYRNSTGAGSAAGTGDYKFLLPASLTADTTDIVLYTTVVGSGTPTPTNQIGRSVATQAAAASLGIVSLYDSTNVRMVMEGAGGTGIVSAGLYALTNAAAGYLFSYKVKIDGWEP